MSEEKKGPAPVEDLVKLAIKEAIAKRRVVEGKEESDGFVELVDSPKPVETVSTPVTPLVGQMMASDLFRGTFIFPANTDFPVTVFKEEDFDVSIRGFIPKIDPSYILTKAHVCNILKAWEMDEKVLMYGPTGAGKSSLLQQICAYVRRPFVRVNSTGDMDSSMIFGNQTARDGATHWVDGTVTEAVRHGAVFAWDEWDVTPPEIAMGLQWLLEDEGKLFLKEMPGTSADKFIIPHKHFKIVAIGNTQGQGDDTGMHSGTNVQNTATLDRFLTAIKVDYMDESTEVNMLMKKYPTRNKDETKKLVQFASLIRQGYKEFQLSLTLSPRALLSICKKQAMGYTLTTAIELVYFNKLIETHQKVAKELLRKIFGSIK